MATKITITFLSFFICFQSTANNILPFWKEDFSIGQIPNGWQVQDSNNNAVHWQHCEDFNLCPPVIYHDTIYPNIRFNSASMENGFIYLAPFQSDGSHSSTLMTDAIDCSAKEQVFLTFNTHILGHFTSNLEEAAIMEVKAGMFGTWERVVVFPKFNSSYVEPDRLALSLGDTLISSFNGQQVCLDISDIAAFNDEVFIRWRWDWEGGSDYFWLLDDINLLDENPLNENAIWGMDPTEGGFAGDLNGWTVPNSFGCKWTWGEYGFIETGDLDDLADLYICSTTASDGAAALNALCNPFPSNSLADLVSPTIDLSATTTDKKLGIRFTQAGVVGDVGNNNLPLTSIMVSIDGGQNYIDTIFLNITEPYGKPFCNTKLVTLPEEVIGADQFVFKFVFSGYRFFWMIDDVRIVELYEHDLRISEDYYAVAPNYNTPVDLIEPIGFRAEVQNVGRVDQENTSLVVEIYQDDSHQIVFSDTLFLGLLEAGSVSNDTSFGKKFLPQPGLSYSGYYKVSSENEDEYARDNIKPFQFETVGRTFSKQKDRFSINAGFNVISNDLRYEVGTCFFIPPGNGANAYSVKFALANANQISQSSTTVSVGVFLYKWKKGGNNGDANADFMANENEYEIVGEALYDINDGSLGMRDVIEVPFDFPIPLEDSTHYFATIDYFSPANINGQQFPMWISGSEEINYNAMFEESESSGQPRYVSMVQLHGESDFQVNAWGLLRIPFIQLKTQMATPTSEEPRDELSIELFPNPTSGQFYLKVPEETQHGKFAYEIYDICGRLALPRQNVEGYVSQLPIDGSQLDNGLYNLRVIFGKQTFNRLFVKVD